MPDGESCDCLEQHKPVVDEQHERKDEEQMVDALQNVLAAQIGIGHENIPIRLACRNDPTWFFGAQDSRVVGSVFECDLHQHVDLQCGQPVDDNLGTDQSTAGRRIGRCFDAGAGYVPNDRRAGNRDVFGKTRAQVRQLPLKDGNLPGDVIAPACYLFNFKQRRTHLVRLSVTGAE